MNVDQIRFNQLYAKIEHFEKAIQLKQIYEWVKTGHINLSEFKGLIGKIT